jgi:hypothetical protein
MHEDDYSPAGAIAPRSLPFDTVGFDVSRVT